MKNESCNYLLSTLMVSLCTLIINSFKGDELVRKIPKALVISMMVVTIIGLVQYYFPDNYLIQNIFANNYLKQIH